MVVVVVQCWVCGAFCARFTSKLLSASKNYEVRREEVCWVIVLDPRRAYVHESRTGGCTSFVPALVSFTCWK